MTYNRPQEIVSIPVADLKAYERNPRINEQAVPALMESIRRIGFRNPIYVTPDLTIIAGHTRLKAARALGMTEVDCIIVSDLTEAEMREMRLSDNRLNELAKWDLGLLHEEVEWLEMDGTDLEYLDLDEFEPHPTEVDFSNLEAMTDSEKTEEYQEFVDKFKIKSTTDDCFTPPKVYEEVLKWAVEEYGLEGAEVIRPFYPGGDYRSARYPDGCVVIDNPPFSIMAEILDFYIEKGICFFLFGPHLTMLTNMKKRPPVNAVIVGAQVVYDNGANVPTSFFTNLGDFRISSAPELLERLDTVQEVADHLPKYAHPYNVTTSAILGGLTKFGADIKLRDEEIRFIGKIDANPVGLFGGGILMSDAAAKRIEEERKRIEEERKIVLELSDREKAIVMELNKMSIQFRPTAESIPERLSP